MNIVVIIPARGGSKSIPQKNIMDFCGKPLIAWSVEQALNCDLINAVYVSTDDAQIASVSEKYGAKVIARPAELATDTASSEQAILDAVNQIEEKTAKKIDVVVFLQGTSPLRESSDIDNALQKFIDEKADSLFSGAVLDDFLIWGYVDGEFSSINYDYKNRGLRQSREKQYVENGSIYIFKPEILRKENNRLGGKIIVHEMALWKTYEIDSYEDIEICQYYMKNKLLDKSLIPAFPDKIDLIVFDFDGIFTDNRVLVTEDGKEAVFCNRSDGLGINIIKKYGIPMLIVSTETNSVVAARAKKLGLNVVQGIANKKNFLVNYAREKKYNLDDIVYIGNDINDLEAMKIVGCPIAPIDAEASVKNVAKIIIESVGGAGVVKEMSQILSKHLERKI